MSSRHALILAAALAATAVVLAQENGPANDDRRALAERYLLVSGNGNLGESIRDALLERIQAQPGVPPGFMEAFKEEAKPALLSEKLVAHYAETLDAETLRAGIAFYETPAGKKLAKAQPALSEGTREASDAWTQASVKATLERLGLASPQDALKEARRNGNETACMGALKTIAVAQSLFREADKDGNGELDYAGSLADLEKTGLIDKLLGSGEKNGYRYTLCRSSETPEFLWMAVASPITPGETGTRHFAINHEGVAYYSAKPFALDTKKCEIKGGTVVGR